MLLYKSASQEAVDAQAGDAAAPAAVAKEVDIVKFCVDAIEGFFQSISLSDGHSLQDTLRFVVVCTLD